MTTIAPPPPPPPPSLPPAGGQPVVTVPNPPAALLRLAPGQQLQAEVARTPDGGGLLLNTPLGAIPAQTATVLPLGAQVLLRLSGLTPQPRLSILTIDGKPPAGAPGTGKGLAGAVLATAKRPAGAPLGSLSQPGQRIAGAAPQPGSPATAVFLRPLGGPAPASAPGAAVKGAAAAPPTAAPGQAPAAGAKAGTKAGANPSLPAATAGQRLGAAATPAAAPAPGSRIAVRIVTIEPPPADPGAFRVPSADPAFVWRAGAQITGRVGGLTTQGQPLLHTPGGVIALTSTEAIATGATLRLQITAAPLPPPPGSAGPLTHQLPGGLPYLDEWPALKDALDTLAKAEPALAQQLAETVLAKPDARLAAGMLFFLSALKGAELRAWLGDDIERALGRLNPALLGRLRVDFRQIGRARDDPGPNDWRIAAIPLNTGAGVEQIRMLVRRLHGGEDEDEEAEPGTRFIVDVTLSRLGRLQLDGLVRGDGKRLDLIVRSLERLSGTMCADIRGLFAQAAEITGLKGSVGFQAGPSGFVEPAAVAAAAGTEGGVGPVLVV